MGEYVTEHREPSKAYKVSRGILIGGIIIAGTGIFGGLLRHAHDNDPQYTPQSQSVDSIVNQTPIQEPPSKEAPKEDYDLILTYAGGLIGLVGGAGMGLYKKK